MIGEERALIRIIKAKQRDWIAYACTLRGDSQLRTVIERMKRQLSRRRPRRMMLDWMMIDDIWNSLPTEIRSLPRDLSSSFYKLFKNFIFARAWAGSASE